MNLYEIDKELEALLDTIEANGGELAPLQDSQLSSLELAKEKKIEAIVNIIKQEEVRVEACKRERERINTLSTKATSKIDWLKTYLSQVIGVGQSYDGTIFKLEWRRSEEVQAILDELPEAYIRTKIEKSPDKIKIKEDIKAGAEVPGALLIQKQNLQIK